MGGFLAAANKRDYVRAAEYLDLHSLPLGMTQSQGPELARQLKIVLASGVVDRSGSCERKSGG